MGAPYGYTAEMLGLQARAPVVVYGLGGSGSVVKAVLEEAGIPVVAATDEGDGVRPEAVDLAYVQCIVKSPGIAMDKPLIVRAKAVGIPVLGEIDLWWWARKNEGARVIGVTGTNGKSTVTALAAHVLRAAGYQAVEGGNLGVPALALPQVGAGGFYVLELSSYQTEMLHDLHLDAAVLTNLTPDHLARHGDMAGYLSAKLRMFAVGKPPVAVVGEAHLAGPVGQVSAHEVVIADTKLVEGRDVGGLVGPHNAQNIACVWELVKAWVKEDDFWRGVASFKPLAHRMEEVARKGGVRFINDSKATNGDSTVWALKSFENIIWICGGQPKSDGLGAAVTALGEVKAALTIGQAGADFASVLRVKGIETVEECGTLDVAVARAWDLARDMGGEVVVLLSPAAASWDQYKSFEHRGAQFVELVKAL